MFFVGSDLRLNIKNMDEFEFEEIIENQIPFSKKFTRYFTLQNILQSN